MRKTKHISATEFTSYCVHCISLGSKMGGQKNERNCYLFALRIWKCQNVVRASSRGFKMVQKWILKNECFQFLKSPDHICFHYFENTEKSAYARFFSVHLLVFFYFLKWKKSKKNGKISQKSRFSLCSAPLFLTFLRYTICL